MEVAINDHEVPNKALRKAPICPKCKVAFGYRVSRGFLFKNVLRWIPVKRYYCYKCKRKHYVWN
jgi:hypothetical protein